jgi:hypothetical protein
MMLGSGSGRKIVSDWNQLSEAGRGRKPFQEFKTENRRVTPVPVKPSSKCEITQVRVVPFQITKGITARIEHLPSKQSRIQSRSLLRLRAPVPSHPCAAPELVQVMTAQLMQSPGRWHSRSPGRRKGFIRFRRFRESILQSCEARTLLNDYSMGNANGGMSGRYGKQLLENVVWWQECSAKVGLGFTLFVPDEQSQIVGQVGQVFRVAQQYAIAL